MVLARSYGAVNGASMTRPWLSAALVLATTACSNVQSVRDGLPQAADISIPLGSSQALSERSSLYLVTYGVTSTVNGGVGWVLTVLHGIASLPPTTQAGKTWTWGPSTPHGLEPKNNYKLTATLNADRSVSYDLYGKTVDEPDSTVGWHVLVSGSHVKGIPGQSGSGTMLLDFDAASRLDHAAADSSAVGKADVTYGFVLDKGYQVAVVFKGVRDGNSGRVMDANYNFTKVAAGPGTFDFVSATDLRGDGSIENLSVRSRWMDTGVGRSDVKASGGSLASTATGSQCWDKNFNTIFADYSWDASKNEGQPSACDPGFQQASYSDLQIPN